MNSHIHSILHNWLRNLCTRKTITYVPWHTSQSQYAYHSTTCSTLRVVKKHKLSYLNPQFVAMQPTEIPRASVDNFTTVYIARGALFFLVLVFVALGCGVASYLAVTPAQRRGQAATRTTSILDSTPEMERPPSSQQTFKNGCLLHVYYVFL